MNFRKPVQDYEGRIAAEQESDHNHMQPFRGTLLCHQHAPAQVLLNEDVLSKWFLSSPLVPRSEMPDIHSDQAIDFIAPDGVDVKVSDPIVKGALVYLRGMWPAQVSYEELLEAARGLTKISSDESDDVTLRTELKKFFLQNYVHCEPSSARCFRRLPEKPQVSSYARYQARNSWWTVNLKHEYVNLGNFERHLLQYLDGNHGRSDLIEKMCQLVKEGVLSPQHEGEKIEQDDQVRSVVEEGVDQALEFLLEQAMIQSIQAVEAEREATSGGEESSTL